MHVMAFSKNKNTFSLSSFIFVPKPTNIKSLFTVTLGEYSDKVNKKKYLI